MLPVPTFDDEAGVGDCLPAHLPGRVELEIQAGVELVHHAYHVTTAIHLPGNNPATSCFQVFTNVVIMAYVFVLFIFFLNKVCVFTTQYRNTELDQCSEEGHYETKTVNSDGTTNESKRNRCFHSIDFGPKNGTFILNFWSSKYPDVQVDMLTYKNLFSYMALLLFL